MPRWRPAEAATSARPSEAAASPGRDEVPAAGTAGVALVWAAGAGVLAGVVLGGAAQPVIQRTSPPLASPEAVRNVRRLRRRGVVLAGVVTRASVMLASPRARPSGWRRAGP